jgi:ribosomal protein L16 Arg81 hydroxylase
MIHPSDPAEFLMKHWERLPLVIHRGDSEYYKDVLSLEDVDQILASSSIRSPEIRLVANGNPVPLSKLRVSNLSTNAVLHDSLFEQYRQGSTIVVQFLNERWESLTRLCENLGRQFSGAFQANVYVTPRESQGLAAHYDNHDVFVLQIFGSKVWRIYETQLSSLPLKEEEYFQPQLADDEPYQEFSLEQGDCAYIPRGWIHEAASAEAASVHITLGVNTITWADVLLQAVQSTFGDSRFHESLPPGFARDSVALGEAEKRIKKLLNVLFEALGDTESILKQAVIVADRGSQTIARGRLKDLNDEVHVMVDSRLRRRAGIDYHLEISGTHVHLYFNGKVMNVPLHATEELKFIANSIDDFSPIQLPGGLDNVGKLVLVRRLISEGFLQVVQIS